MGRGVARALVFGSSAAVLVLEILAGRLLAPYIGVSLETFTGIIGVVLAGIAVGAWAGGALADQQDARRLIGITLALGGVLAWLALPIVRALGPQFGDGPTAIVLLTTSAFFLPAAVLSAVPPMVAKLRLSSLEETGAIVGGLSAAGTLGALAGTFVTGFVLVAAMPTRPIVLLVGLFCVVGGAVAHWHLTNATPTVAAVLLVVAGAAASAPVGPPCDHETGYSCVTIEVDPDNPSGRSLILDRSRHAYVDLVDPTNHDIRYVRLFTQVADALPAGPLESLHVGGGGFSFPRHLQAVRPGSTDLVLEIDDELVRVVEDELGLVLSDSLRARTGDARLAIDDLDDDAFGLVVGDAFAGTVVPWHLTTREFVREVDRVARADALYVLNVIDGGSNRFARAELATLREVFAHVAVILPRGGIPADRQVNQIFVASQSPIPQLMIDPADGELLPLADTDDFIDGASALRDDFAPVDQLLFS